MLKKTIALATLAAALAVTPATSAFAEPYNGKVPTQTTIEVTTHGVGNPITIVVSASATGTEIPEGDIAVTISKSTSAARGSQAVVAAPIFSTTVHFEGDPITIEGPSLPKGRYLGTAALTPDNGDLFLPSDDTDAFRLGVRNDVGAEDDGNNGAGLPDTGGPNMMWLLVGTGLVAAGAGGVAYSRRRRQGVVAA